MSLHAMGVAPSLKKSEAGRNHTYMSEIKYEGNGYICKGIWKCIEHKIEHEIQIFQVVRVWVITAKWDFMTMIEKQRPPLQSLNGTLSFALHTNVVPGFDDFLDSISPISHHHLVHFWEAAFKCYFLTVAQPHPDIRVCTGQEKLSSLPGTVFETRMSGESYSIYNAVYTVVHALHALHASTGKQTARGHGGKRKPGNIQPWQVSLSSFLATSHSSIGFRRQFLKASFTHCGIDG
ncbi:UNVERIFIED_CONTAM: hypothetical protein K2H54_035647 [Gekko kuhli]